MNQDMRKNGGAWLMVFWARLGLAGFNIATRTGAGGVSVWFLFHGFYSVFSFILLLASGCVYSYPPRSIARTYIHFSFGESRSGLNC